MKAFLICTALFLLLSLLVTSTALWIGGRIGEMQSLAEEGARQALAGDAGDATVLFASLKKQWEDLRLPLLLTMHHSALKPIDAAVTDAENAVSLEKGDALYAALVRLEKELLSLKKDLTRPAL